MAELDYAYLADYARVANGKIDAIGASFTHILAPSLPAALSFSLAGRIRSTVSAPTADIRIELSAKDEAAFLVASGQVSSNGALPYGTEEKIGILFAYTTQIALEEEGVYEVKLFVDEILVRLLAFSVAVPASR